MIEFPENHEGPYPRKLEKLSYGLRKAPLAETSRALENQIPIRLDNHPCRDRLVGLLVDKDEAAGDTVGLVAVGDDRR